MDYDLIVIGSGGAGAPSAHLAKAAGWKVAIIDSVGLGGTCSQRGCHPKKVLVDAVKAIDHVRHRSGTGVTGDVHISWSELIAFKKTFTDPVAQGQAKKYADEGIDIFYGSAHFIDPQTISIGDKTISAKHFVIATGARPRPLPINGAELAITSDDFLTMEELPARIAFIGGGYIGMEFAHIAARAGSRVTVVQKGDRVLTPFEPDMVDIIVKASEDAGIRFSYSCNVQGLRKEEDGIHVSTDKEDFVADVVVASIGRIPVTDLDLEKAGVECGSRGITVNDQLQTSQAHIYAGGDCADTKPQLTPVSAREGEVIAHNLIHNAKKAVEYGPIPSATYVIPHMGSVGMTEAQAKEAGKNYRIVSADTGSWFIHKHTGNNFAGHKVIIDSNNDFILGAHLVGGSAHELINIFALAMKEGITAARLKDLLYVYPTESYDIKDMV